MKNLNDLATADQTAGQTQKIPAGWEFVSLNRICLRVDDYAAQAKSGHAIYDDIRMGYWVMPSASPQPPQAAPKPVAWIRREWNGSGSASLVFERPEKLLLPESARGVLYEPLYAEPQPVITDDEIKAGKDELAELEARISAAHKSPPQPVAQERRPLTDAERDAERYRALRDPEIQASEDDPCVSDSSFATYFGDDLDKVADMLVARRKSPANGIGSTGKTGSVDCGECPRTSGCFGNCMKSAMQEGGAA